jgi:hypothetical protein
MPDPDFQQEDALKKHNLEVTVTEKGQTAEVVETVRETGLEVQITVDAEEDKRAVMRADMRDEVEASVMGPGSVGPQTKAMTKGIVKWVTICTLVGSLSPVLVGLLAWPSTTALITSAAVGAAAGATFGFIIGGFLGPREHNEGQTDAESNIVVGIHTDNPEDIEKAEHAVSELETTRTDRVSVTGRPVDEPSKDVRPLRGEPPT